MPQTPRPPVRIPPLSRTRKLGLLAAVALFLLPWLVEFPGLSEQGHRIFSLFLMAIALWVTEAVPLHATAAIIILLEILFLSDQSVLPAPEGFQPPSYTTYFHALAHPVLMLFLGGFFLADGASKFNLDRNLARVLLRPFGSSPRMIILGLMLITAVFSMFMSNTATTATMMAVVLPVLATLPPGDRLRTGLALAIPLAANIGGLGTPIGSPPNAIAVGALAEAGTSIGFTQWMIMAVPLAAAVMLAAWLLLWLLYARAHAPITIAGETDFDTSTPAVIFYVTFALTVALWLSEPLHGLGSSVVGFFPVAVLLSTRVFGTRDLQSIQWHVLWLVAGGIALGSGVRDAGLDQWLIGLVEWQSLSALGLIVTLCLVSLVLSTFISNSATANLIVPIGLSLAMTEGIALTPLLAGVFIAVSCSLAMALPVSTPPNAIAHSTGAVRTRDMAVIGATLGAGGVALCVFVGPWLWRLLGVLPDG